MSSDLAVWGYVQMVTWPSRPPGPFGPDDDLTSVGIIRGPAFPRVRKIDGRASREGSGCRWYALHPIHQVRKI